MLGELKDRESSLDSADFTKADEKFGADCLPF